MIGMSRMPTRIFKEASKLLREVAMPVVTRPIQIGSLDIVKPITLISILLAVCVSLFKMLFEEGLCCLNNRDSANFWVGRTESWRDKLTL